MINICSWELFVDDLHGNDEYRTDCGHQYEFVYGRLKQNPDFKFCPFCGKPIKSDDA